MFVELAVVGALVLGPILVINHRTRRRHADLKAVDPCINFSSYGGGGPSDGGRGGGYHSRLFDGSDGEDGDGGGGDGGGGGD